jgi:hypothetical protein
MQIRQSTNTSTLLVSEKFQSTSGITTNTYSTRERERERERERQGGEKNMRMKKYLNPDGNNTRHFWWVQI